MTITFPYIHFTQSLRTLAASICALFPIVSSYSQTPSVPEGFTPIFNGKNLDGWHWSRTVHHGTIGNASIDDGCIVIKQKHYGQGGLLVTDRRYRNFELYLEVLLDSSNGGIFFRSTEGGSAYQVEMMRPGNSIGSLIGEQLRLGERIDLSPRVDIDKVWKDGEYNRVRLKVTGDAPHAILWVNDTQVWDIQFAANDKVAGETDGVIGLQLHFSSTASAESAIAYAAQTWLPNGVHRYRNIGIKELN